ncbi:hypothetical protein [Kitasatospora purpeofusca]|uniref:hypothetical protein n=1 Tax=Kitasatospora purpeofusca TaxID=67352 RepID=UPI002251AB1C|nr:hypothetical protein [Kitasatospora purpeofusca]MCX4684145.1 hypothetical protein [Kitasatospora purpeofusca]
MTIENPDDPRRFIAHLPIGERLPIPEDAAPSWSIFPYEGELTVRPLDAAELPEPARPGGRGTASHGPAPPPPPAPGLSGGGRRR